MQAEASRLSAPVINWYLRRNPTYLLSAAAMAVGAKLYLDVPNTPAGQVGHILLTLGLLELYEVTVAGILVALHRSRRSPEDLPSLMVVAALFWTGPLAATLELTARTATLGYLLAAAAWLIALLEFWGVARAVRARISPAGRMICVLSTTLVAALPAALRVPYGEPGTSELALYGAWWLLGAAALFSVAAMRWHLAPGARRKPRAAEVELGLLVIVLVSSGAHLYGMNYVFFGNARSFYAAPLLAALGVLLFELLALLRVGDRRWLLLATLMPMASLVGALGGFSSRVPTEALPPPLRDALAAWLALAGGCWWYGAARHRSVALLHMGVAAFAVAAARAWPGGGGLPTEPLAPDDAAPLAVAAAGFGAAAYLLLVGVLLRSRSHVTAALLVNVAAVAALTLGRWEWARIAVFVVAAWTWIALTHLHGGGGGRVPAAALLVALACYYDADAELRWIARGQVIGAIAVFAVLGAVWPATRYRLLGGLTGSAWGAFMVTRHCFVGPSAVAAVTVASAFVLLASAAAISWHKSRLMRVDSIPAALPPSDGVDG